MSLQTDMLEYHQQMKMGSIQRAYRGLMDFMLGLRNGFQKEHPQYTLPGSLYAGFMDMTYFAIVPDFLKQRNLKIAVVFLHEAFRFEVWLSGVNRQVQEQYWESLKARGGCKFPLVAKIKGSDAILEHILVEDPDFSDTQKLMAQIEAGIEGFIDDIEGILVSLN